MRLLQQPRGLLGLGDSWGYQVTPSYHLGVGVPQLLQSWCNGKRASRTGCPAALGEGELCQLSTQFICLEAASHPHPHMPGHCPPTLALPQWLSQLYRSYKCVESGRAKAIRGRTQHLTKLQQANFKIISVYLKGRVTERRLRKRPASICWVTPQMATVGKRAGVSTGVSHTGLQGTWLQPQVYQRGGGPEAAPLGLEPPFPRDAVSQVVL